ncbi:hypothetical protein TcCL_NonESM04958 [Trypanosoma cruzi]|nr:hypothetical protein TcCL_NonESM04958 [Trypanosoma cruzi]
MLVGLPHRAGCGAVRFDSRRPGGEVSSLSLGWIHSTAPPFVGATAPNTSSDLHKMHSSPCIKSFKTSAGGVIVTKQINILRPLAVGTAVSRNIPFHLCSITQMNFRGLCDGPSL